MTTYRFVIEVNGPEPTKLIVDQYARSAENKLMTLGTRPPRIVLRETDNPGEAQQFVDDHFAIEWLRETMLSAFMYTRNELYAGLEELYESPYGLDNGDYEWAAWVNHTKNYKTPTCRVEIDPDQVSFLLKKQAC